MARYENTLLIDFGETGPWYERYNFSVRLNALALSALIDEARRGVRIYELSMIQRPGDLWRYIAAELVEAPESLHQRLRERWQQATPRWGDHPWPEGFLPILEFNKLFWDGGEDTDPVDACWLGHLNSRGLDSFLEQLLAWVRTVKYTLGWDDLLAKHELDLIKQVKHPYDFSDPSEWTRGFQATKFDDNRFGDAFYEKARELISEPDVISVAWRGQGDYTLLRMLCTEQRERANRQQCKPGRAFMIHAQASCCIDITPWDAKAMFYSEGIGYGDLFIDQNSVDAYSKELMETDFRSPRRYLLCLPSDIDIDGYTRQMGDGWTLYTRSPRCDNRTIASYRANYMIPLSRGVLALREKEQSWTVFSHERLVFVISGKSDVNWFDLAQQIARLERNDAQVKVIVSFHRDEFAAAGCKHIIFLQELDSATTSPDFGPKSRYVLENADVLCIVETNESTESALQQAMGDRPPQLGMPYVVALGSCQGCLSSAADLSADNPAIWLEDAIK